MKKITLVLSTLLCTCLLFGCADNNNQYIKLGQYKNLQVEALSSMEVTEEDIDNYIKNALENQAVYTESDKKKVEKEDYVSLNYSGTIDGKELDGFTANDLYIQVGMAGYLPGFEDQLIGMEVGKTYKIEVTIPESYPDDSIKGKKAVFTVKINSINEKSIPTLTDEVASSITGTATTVSEYRESIRKNLLADKETYKKYLVQEAIVNNAEVIKYPEGQVEAMVEDYKKQMKDYAQSIDQTFEDYIKNLYGYSEEELDKNLTESMQKKLKTKLVFKEIAAKENLKMSDAEKEAAALGYAKGRGAETIEEFLNGSSKEDFYDYIEQTKVVNFLAESATVVEKKLDETASSSAAE